jgi:hypothetical protein
MRRRLAGARVATLTAAAVAIFICIQPAGVTPFVYPGC